MTHYYKPKTFLTTISLRSITTDGHYGSYDLFVHRARERHRHNGLHVCDAESVRTYLEGILYGECNNGWMP